MQALQAQRYGHVNSALLVESHPGVAIANTELENAKSKVFNARGDLRTGRLAVVAAAIAGVVGFLLIMRAIVQRGRSD